MSSLRTLSAPQSLTTCPRPRPRTPPVTNESDLLGRLGGDEFIVVAEALHDGPRNGIELTDKLLAQMK